MQVDSALAAFLSSPVMIIVGTADHRGRPEIGRAVGCRAAPGAERLDLILCALHWPKTIANIEATARAAVTFSRPADYETFQLKGVATLRDAEPEDLALADRYMTGISFVLNQLGIPSSFSPTWLSTEGARVLSLEVEEIFVQTPGPRAGQAMEAT